MSANEQPACETSFEEALARLQEIVNALESGEQSLEEGLALYREGAECARFCRERLEQARHEIALWQNGGETPFEAGDATGKTREEA